MGPRFLVCALTLTCFWGSVFADTNYLIKCGPKGTLQSFKADVSSKDCSIYQEMGMPCGDSRSSAAGPTQIALKSPMDTYYSSRDSRFYDREVVTKILQDSVCDDGDPYFNLGLVLIESPPFDRVNTLYLKTYGVPPLDSIAGAAAIGCSLVRQTVTQTKLFSIDEWKNLMTLDKYTGDLKRTKIRNVKKGDVVTLGNTRDGSASNMTVNEEGVLGQEIYVAQVPTGAPASRKTFYLSGATDATGTVYRAEPKDVYVREPAVFVINKGDGDCQAKCCARVVAPIHMTRQALEESLDRQLGHQFIADKFSHAARLPHVKALSDPIERFANLAQAYNGYGKLGKSEKVANKCISGLDMKKTPIYGAGVGEMMLNSVMANSEVRDIVESARQRCGKKVEKSYLCEALGQGTFKINAKKFALLQKKYLSKRDCPDHTYDYKPQVVSTKPAPEAGHGAP